MSLKTVYRTGKARNLEESRDSMPGWQMPSIVARENRCVFASHRRCGKGDGGANDHHAAHLPLTTALRQDIVSSMSKLS